MNSAGNEKGLKRLIKKVGDLLGLYAIPPYDPKKETPPEAPTTQREAFEVYVQKLDAIDEFYRLLEAYELKHGHVPGMYNKDYQRWKTEKPWRQDPVIIRKLKRAARIAARNAREKKSREAQGA